MDRMALKPTLSLADLIRKHKNDTHHIRCKIAPEMFHYYCRNMSAIEAENLVCELLQITHAGFEYAIRKDPLAELETYKRNQNILDLRCDGFSFASICETVKLSRVQVWRIIEAYRGQIETINFMESRKVHNTRLKYPDLDKIQALRDKLKNLGSATSRGYRSAIKHNSRETSYLHIDNKKGAEDEPLPALV
jgi:hypothetical protein